MRKKTILTWVKKGDLGKRALLPTALTRENHAGLWQNTEAGDDDGKPRQMQPPEAHHGHACLKLPRPNHVKTVTKKQSTSTMTAEKSRPIRSRHRKCLRVRFEFMEPAAESVCIAGTFNDWRPEVTPMIHLGAGHWVKELTLPPDHYEYLLVVDGDWIPDPLAEDYLPNPFGGMNSVLTVSPPASASALSPKARPSPKTPRTHGGRVVAS
jgi:Glycogen recognition site of AMP-activated protein kinase